MVSDTTTTRLNAVAPDLPCSKGWDWDRSATHWGRIPALTAHNAVLHSGHLGCWKANNSNEKKKNATKVGFPFWMSLQFKIKPYYFFTLRLYLLYILVRQSIRTRRESLKRAAGCQQGTARRCRWGSRTYNDGKCHTTRSHCWLCKRPRGTSPTLRPKGAIGNGAPILLSPTFNVCWTRSKF